MVFIITNTITNYWINKFSTRKLLQPFCSAQSLSMIRKISQCKHPSFSNSENYPQNCIPNANFPNGKISTGNAHVKREKIEGIPPLGARTNVNFGSRFCQRKNKKKHWFVFLVLAKKKSNFEFSQKSKVILILKKCKSENENRKKRKKKSLHFFWGVVGVRCARKCSSIFCLFLNGVLFYSNLIPFQCAF